MGNMDVILRTGFEKVTHGITFQPESVPKGRKLVESGHVQRVEEIRRDGHGFVIKCRVIRQTSVSKTPYSTNLRLGANRRVVSTSCDCVYKDSGRCKHVAALIHFVNNGESLSKTSYEQTWGKPSLGQLMNEKYSKGAMLSQMFDYKYEPQQHRPLDIPQLLQDVDSSSLLQILSNMNPSQDESAVEPAVLHVEEKNHTKSMEEDCYVCFDNFVHFSSEYPVFEEGYELPEPLKEFYESYVALSLPQLRETFCKTLNQSNCAEWFDFRKLRLSASSDVHKIKVRTKTSEEALVSKLLWPNKVDNASTRYGLQNEPVAIELYEKFYDCEVKRVGVLSSVTQPWICASLDGVVTMDGCILKSLEIKCPSSCKNIPIVDYETLKCNVSYLEFRNGELDLRRSSQHFTQCQVQMYLSGMSECDFFIYSPAGSVCIQIPRDDEFLSDVIVKSGEFYFKNYLPKLFENRFSLLKNFPVDKSQALKRSLVGRDIKNIS